MKIGASWEEVKTKNNKHPHPFLTFVQNIKTCIYPIDVRYNNHTYTLLTPINDILVTIKQ